jgi:REP element-mobilizing transposase RayT
MPRIARFVRSDVPTIYHVISRTALAGFPLEAAEKNYLLELVRRLSKFYFVDVLGFCIMSNHFHWVGRVYPENHLSDDEIRKRLKFWFPEGRVITDQDIGRFRTRWSSLSSFIKDIKQQFTNYYNQRHNREGFFWGGRFKSLIVQDGRSLINLLAYVDLNPVRAGIVKRPEAYRWCSLGYHVLTDNKDDVLSLNFGMREWGEDKPSEMLRKYRQFLYETGAVNTGKGQAMDAKIVARERKKNFALKRFELFSFRARYFTDAGIMGSKEFVQEVFDQVKHLLDSKNERRFTPVGGIGGVYSMKSLKVE